MMLKELGDLLKTCWKHEQNQRPSFETLHDSITTLMKSARPDIKFPQQFSTEESEEELRVIFQLTNKSERNLGQTLVVLISLFVFPFFFFFF
jgi:hypothetical protein